MTSPSDLSFSELLRATTETLAGAGIATAEVDAQLLAAHAFGRSRSEVQVAVLMNQAAPTDRSAFDALVARRAAREPLQHLTGRAPFRHLELQVGPGVFVPRPETETVAQLAIDALRAQPDAAPIAVDLCTGSGAIALSLADEVPHARVFGVELSEAAVAYARRNAQEAASGVTIIHGDLAEALPELDGTVSVVISNPPYVPEGAIPRDPEVREWDPPLALYGGADGLDIVRVLSRRAQALLRPGGMLVIEHGEWQGAAIRELLTVDGWRAAATHPDLTMRDRATVALRP